jgi:phosphatidylinositol N-acetylglucosaminyltransferase subunit A
MQCQHPLFNMINYSLDPNFKFSICMISDFFYPKTGGAEAHIYHLSQHLSLRGHKVIIITNAYGNRKGIRYLPNNLKVYHIPWIKICGGTTLPTMYGLFPILRSIWIRERTMVVHGHQNCSNFCHEALFHANTMGLKTCFTDHSLYGLGDIGSILINKVFSCSLSNIDHVICVSNVCRENTVVRGMLDPKDVYVIPNSIISDNLKPSLNPVPLDKIVIIVLSRLVYRKGIDILIRIIPKICFEFPKTEFIIGGDGSRRIELEQMIERFGLETRVKLLGEYRHSEIREILIQGHIFLNTSLTEAFCMTILEAACCGLLIVSTRVGGIPEILPDHMIMFSEPIEDDILNTISMAIQSVRNVVRRDFHEEVREMYSWQNVAERTERVYHACMDKDSMDTFSKFKKAFQLGPWFGKIMCILKSIDCVFLMLLEIVWPESKMERVE